MSRFHDAKSRVQVALYRVYELHAIRWRNAKNLERWNDSCRDRWEAAQVRPLTDDERQLRAAAQADLVGPVDWDGLPNG